jgi:hypothetical protein
LLPWSSLRRASSVGAAIVVLIPATAASQGLWERLNLDRLRLTGLGINTGPVGPSRAENTQAYGVFADYGYITSSWRVLFSATYWGSHFDDDIVQELEDKLREQIIDPSGDDTLDLGRIDVSDIALEIDMRYTRWRSAAFVPYVGGSLGAHIINAEAPFINDTFVESALDNISAGFALFAGVDTAPFSRMSLGAQARMNLLSNLRYWSGRAFLTYFFGNAPTSSAP